MRAALSDAASANCCQKHDYQKFASVLCEVDYITSGLAGLTLIRTSTIAYGAKKCDFRFRKNP